VKLVTDSKPVAFFQGQNLGLTTALAVLKSGFVLVGNLPTTNGTNIRPPGSLLVINPQGKLVGELKDSTLLDGPWDMTVAIDQGPRVTAFVSDVLNGTVARIDINIGDSGAMLSGSSHIIASGYAHRTDPAALVVGPTGLAYDAPHDVLYVASTGDNAVFAVSGALALKHDGGMGRLIYQDNTHLHGPLALALAPNGDLVTANGDAVPPLIRSIRAKSSSLRPAVLSSRRCRSIRQRVPHSASRSDSAAVASHSSRQSTTARIQRLSGRCARAVATDG
jgi:hypothetical protein